MVGYISFFITSHFPIRKYISIFLQKSISLKERTKNVLKHIKRSKSIINYLPEVRFLLSQSIMQNCINPTKFTPQFVLSIVSN